MAVSSPEYSVVMVTGASRGIGRAAALALAREGWKVAAVARSREELEAVTGQIRDEGGQAGCYPVDVADGPAVREAVSRICRDLGPPLGLVNNAAVIGPVGPVLSLDPFAWKGTIDTNLAGAFFCAHFVLEKMVEQKSGTVLNLISGMGLRVFPRFSAYSISKAGLIHLTRVLAEEVRTQGVRVNALDPGLVDTSLQDRLEQLPAEVIGKEMYQRLKDFRRERLLKTPDTIGEWIAAFFSDMAWKITGEVGTLSDFAARHGIPVPPQGKPS